MRIKIDHRKTFRKCSCGKHLFTWKSRDNHKKLGHTVPAERHKLSDNKWKKWI